MTTTGKGTTRLQLPNGAVEAHYDDTEAPLAYDPTLADELLEAASGPVSLIWPQCDGADSSERRNTGAKSG